jgi:hypothetical protein
MRWGAEPLLNDTTKLQNILKSLKRVPFVRVGILGSSKTKNRDVSTNATIGLTHEMGFPEKNIPQRSFLQMPIHTHFYEAARKNSRLKSLYEKSSCAGDLYEVLKLAGILAEGVIDDAFATAGFGTWPMTTREALHILNNPESEKHPSPLIDTGELRKSITSEVVG